MARSTQSRQAEQERKAQYARQITSKTRDIGKIPAKNRRRRNRCARHFLTFRFDIRPR